MRKKSTKFVGKPADENQRTPQVARAYELANEMVQKGLCGSDHTAIKIQVDEIIKWNDDAFAAMKRVVDATQIMTQQQKDVIFYDTTNEDGLINDYVDEKDIESAFAKINAPLPNSKKSKIVLQKKITPMQKLKVEIEEKQKVIVANQIYITNLKDQKEKLSKDLNAQISALKSDKVALIKDVSGYINLIKLAMVGLETIGSKAEVSEKTTHQSLVDEMTLAFGNKRF
jgi:hypothetical protein